MATSFLRYRRSGSAFSLLALAAGLSRAPEVAACSPPELGWVLSPGYLPVPANSGVAARLYCSAECGTGPVLADIKLYASGSADPVAGSVVLSGGEELARWVVFRPNSALEIGRRYHLRLGDAPPSDPSELIEVIEAQTPQASALTLLEKSFVRKVEVGPWVCCSIGPEDSCGNPPCHSNQVLTEATVWVKWDESQWLSRVLRPGAAVEPPWSWSDGATDLPVDQGATDACYTLELKSLIDDSVHRFDERCLALPDDVQLGLREVEPAALSEFLGSCEGPPDSYETEWCVNRTAYCSAHPDPACDGTAGASGGGALAERCPAAAGGGASGGGSTSGGSSGEAAIGGSGGAVKDDSRGGQGAVSGSAGTAKGAAATARGGGCSISGRSRRSDVGLLAFGVLFAVRLLRRRVFKQVRH